METMVPSVAEVQASRQVSICMVETVTMDAGASTCGSDESTSVPLQSCLGISILFYLFLTKLGVKLYPWDN